jgi:hypothetical protein
VDISNHQYGRTIKYKIKAKWPEAHITEVRVSRETASYVYVGSFGSERREAKHCEFHEYYDTWEDAFLALKKNVDTRLFAANEQLRIAKELVSRVAALKKPERQENKPR